MLAGKGAARFVAEEPVSGEVMEGVYTFGDFRLETRSRRLSRGNQTVPIGDRALDILLLLIRTPGETVKRADIVAEVWGASQISDGALRFQINELRSALKSNGARLIGTVARTGYYFSGTVSFRSEPRFVESAIESPRQSAERRKRFETGAIVGRDDTIRETIDSLGSNVSLTITGPGGIGKTTVAKCAARALLAEGRPDPIWLDLSNGSEDEDIWPALARELGVGAGAQNLAEAALSALPRNTPLLVLDCCEHVIDRVGRFIRDIRSMGLATPILATSRETLRIRDERVIRLAPLGLPGANEHLDFASAGAYGALELFIRRARDMAGEYTLAETDVDAIRNIVRRLDGIPLAIELAVAHLSSFSPQDLDRLLQKDFDLVGLLPRDTPDRHQTLRNMIDWSYDRLEARDKTVLDQLSIFVGGADLDACLHVISGEGVSQNGLIEALARLVEKSLVIRECASGRTLYRLLDTTRAHCLAKLRSRGEEDRVLSRLTRYLAAAIRDQTSVEGHKQTVDRWFGPACPNLANLRLAKAWAFGAGGDPALAVELAQYAAPLLMQLSLLSECESMARDALTDREKVDAPFEVWQALSAFLGAATLATKGPTDDAKAALEAGSSRAATPSSARIAALAASGLYWLWMYRGEPLRALGCAEALRPQGDADLGEDDDLVADNYAAMAHQAMGRTAAAERELRDVVDRQARVSLGRFMRIGSDPGLMSQIFLMKTLWLQGRFRSAIDLYEHIRPGLRAPEHGLYRAWALNEALVPLYCAMGDYDAARAVIEELAASAQGQSMQIRCVAGLAAEAALETKVSGRVRSDLPRLLGTLRRNHFHLLLPWLEGVHAEALLAEGDLDACRAILKDAISFCEANQNGWWLPELSSLMGQLETRSANDAMAAAWFEKSHCLSTSQGSLALAIRNLHRVKIWSDAPLALRKKADEWGHWLSEHYPDDGDPMFWVPKD